MIARLWLDDLRPAPGPDWLVARTSAEAIAILETEDVGYISFDHDLGGDDTAMAVVDWLDERAALRPDYPIPDWGVHAANPVGGERIRAAMRAMWERRLEVTW